MTEFKMPEIELKNVGLVYEGKEPVEALRDISLKIGAGESYSFIGPSGCGKSSLLFLISGLIRPTRGKVLIKGKPIKKPREDCALILQDYGLLPWKNVWQNTVLGLQIRKVSPAAQKKIAFPILEELGLDNFLNLYPNQLSGGQRQRVAIARALALKPDIFLLDEPLSALDALTRENLQELILKIWLERKITFLLVTHNIEEAVFLGQKIVVFTPGPGRILSVLPNPEAGEPGYRYSTKFHRLSNKIRNILEDSYLVP